MRQSRFTDPPIVTIPDEGQPGWQRMRRHGIGAAKHDAAILAR